MTTDDNAGDGGPAAALFERLRTGGVAVARDVLAERKRLGAKDAVALQEAALGHKDAAVRELALRDAEPDELPAIRRTVQERVVDKEPAVRRAALALLMRARDRASVPALKRALGKKELELDEHKQLLIALGLLGGRAAGQALRDEIERQADKGLRAAAVLALAQAEGEEARPLLERLNKKRFGSRRVKAAAEQALRRLDEARAHTTAAASGERASGAEAAGGAAAREEQEPAVDGYLDSFSDDVLGPDVSQELPVVAAASVPEEPEQLTRADFLKKAGWQALQEDQLAAAERYLRQAVEEARDDAEAARLLAWTLLEQERVVEAREEAMRARQLAPGRADIEALWVALADEGEG